MTPTVDTTYEITAVGVAGTTDAIASVTILVLSIVVIDSLTATPSAVAPGGSTTLAWETTGATSVSIDQGVGSGLNPDGSIAVTVPSDQKLYHLSPYGH